jgi:hypothetical protein
MRRLLAVLTVVVLAAVASGLLLAQSNPTIGTWRLSLAKSKYNPGPPPKSQTRTFEAQGDGVKVSVEGIAADGSRAAYSYAPKYDGKDYAITGSGRPGGSDTIAFKRIDAFTFEATLKKAGKVVVTNQLVVSKDGKVMTLNAKGTTASGQPVNDVVVFDRQ